VVVVATTVTGFSAYSPDLDGRVDKGVTLKEVQMYIREAMAIHVEGLRAKKLEGPASRTLVAFVTVAA